MKKSRLVLIVAWMLVAFSANSDPQDTVLCDQEIKVLRDDFKEVHFLIPEDTKEPVQIKGSFKTKGGFNDDLTFYALTKDNYVRWFSHRTYESLAKFEKKPEGKFQFEAKAGETYYFVLDNFFSTVSNKTVKLRIELLPQSQNP